MADHLKLRFADGTVEDIEVPAGEGGEHVEQLIAGSGNYKRGWIKDANGRQWFHLGALVSVELRPEDAEA